MSWKHDLSSQLSHRGTDQLAIDIGDAVLFLKHGQMKECKAELFELGKRTVSSFSLPLLGNVAGKLIPTRFTSNTENSLSAVGHKRKLFVFDNATATFCVYDLSDVDFRNLPKGDGWRPVDTSKLCRKGEPSSGFVVLACGEGRHFGQLGQDVAMVLCRSCASSWLITVHFFMVESGVFSEETMRMNVPLETESRSVGQSVKAAVHCGQVFVVAGTSCRHIRHGNHAHLPVQVDPPRLPEAAFPQPWGGSRGRTQKKPSPIEQLHVFTCGNLSLQSGSYFQAPVEFIAALQSLLVGPTSMCLEVPLHMQTAVIFHVRLQRSLSCV